MYNDYFGFRENPFDVTPNPKFFYSSQNHQEALASLILGVEEQKGLICLIGEVGTGKTLLLNALMQEISNKTRIVNLIYPVVTFEELLIMVLTELGISAIGRNKVQMIHLLHEYLMRQVELGRTLALVIDEAQNLNHTVLEEIRLLSNIETSTKRLLQIILSGQPELGEILEQKSMRQIRQRIGVICKLQPLNFEEAQEYIVYRLSVAGYEGTDLFDKKAVQEIYSFSGGIPRLINILCDNSLMITYAMEKKRVKLGTVQEAIDDQSCKLSVAEKATPPLNQSVVQKQNRSHFGAVASFIAIFLIPLLIFLFFFMPFDSNKNSQDVLLSRSEKVFTKVREGPVLPQNALQTVKSVPSTRTYEESPESSGRDSRKDSGGGEDIPQQKMAQGRYLVRAGVYFNTYYLERLEQMLEKQGYAPYILTRTVMRNRYLLRMGPLEDLASFNQIKDDLSTENLKGDIVSEKGNLYAMIWSSKDKKKLDELSDRLSKLGYTTVIENKPVSKKIYYLMVGDYSTMEEAERIKHALTRFNIESLILLNHASDENKDGGAEVSANLEGVPDYEIVSSLSRDLK